MDDGKVLVKKVIIADAEDMGTAEQKPPAPLSEGIQMMVTTMLRKEGKSFARVSFLRGKDWAEGIVPGAVLEKSEGFSEEEVLQLEAYLAAEEKMILAQAKQINPIKNLFDLK